MKSQTRNSCHCARNSNANLEGESRLNVTGDSYRNGTNKNGLKTTDTSNKRNKSKRVTKDDTLPVGDERVSELYIFPNSNVVEFTDVLCDNKV